MAIEDKLVSMGFKRECVFVVSYCNGVFGYLPPKEEVGIGGYEVLSAPNWYDTSFFVENSEDSVLECVYNLLGSIK